VGKEKQKSYSLKHPPDFIQSAEWVLEMILMRKQESIS